LEAATVTVGEFFRKRREKHDRLTQLERELAASSKEVAERIRSIPDWYLRRLENEEPEAPQQPHRGH
jgi:hypothetical protein